MALTAVDNFLMTVRRLALANDLWKTDCSDGKNLGSW